MRVLVVEDDATTAALLVGRNVLAAVEIARSTAFDAIVLDVMLPGLDGFNVVHRLRQPGCSTPILMLTAGDLTLNTATREVTRKDRPLQLTRTEYGLLALLVCNAGRIGPREPKLIHTVRGVGYTLRDNTG